MDLFNDAEFHHAVQALLPDPPLLPSPAVVVDSAGTIVNLINRLYDLLIMIIVK